MREEDSNISRYLIKYGTDMTNHVMQMVNSLRYNSPHDFFEDYKYFYYLFPKINFYNKKIILEYFMDEFDKNNKEYLRIQKMFEYISNSLCGIRKRIDKTYILFDFFEDLEGYDRTGECFDIKYFLSKRRIKKC